MAPRQPVKAEWFSGNSPAPAEGLFEYFPDDASIIDPAGVNPRSILDDDGE
jgi:hypothetical protein